MVQQNSQWMNRYFANMWNSKELDLEYAISINTN